MKTFVLSMISIAATIAAMTACTSESDPIDDLNPKDEKAEINLTANILKAEILAETKAAVTGTSLQGVQILRKDTKDADHSATNWGATPIVVEIKDDATNIFETNKQYYTPSGENAYFIGFYPAGTFDSSTGVVTFTNMTGKEDLLLSNLLDAGKRGSATSSPKLTFQHKLALIKFTFKQGTGYPDDDNVTSLIVKGAELPASMDVNTGNITYTTNNADAGISAFSSKTYTITQAGSTISDDDALMIEPGKDITLEITTTKGTFTVSSVKINNSDVEKIAAGKQYNISITFNGSAADATATITSWGNVIAGEGTTN